MLCSTPVTSRPHTTAKPLLMPPSRLVMCPTMMPPRACTTTGTQDPTVHPLEISACKKGAWSGQPRHALSHQAWYDYSMRVPSRGDDGTSHHAPSLAAHHRQTTRCLQQAQGMSVVPARIGNRQHSRVTWLIRYDGTTHHVECELGGAVALALKCNPM